MNVYNFFNQRDPATEYFWRGPWFDRHNQGPQAELWYLYGMDMPKPTDNNYINYRRYQRIPPLGRTTPRDQRRSPTRILISLSEEQ